MLEILKLRPGKIILEMLERDYTTVSERELQNPVNRNQLA